MEAVLLVIHLVVAIGIIAVVLLQPSEAGGFLGSSGSMSNMMMPRRSADFMTRLTTILAGCFFGTSLLLAILATNRPAHQSILDVAVDKPAAVVEKTAAPAAPEAAKTPAAPAEAPKPETPKAPISK